MALKVATGTYTGDSTDNRAITGLGFSPKLVVVCVNGSGQRWVKFSSFDGTYATSSLMQTDNTDLSSANNKEQIVSCDADGFTVSYNNVYGDANSPNATGYTYYWWALGGDATDIYAGKYTGNGVDGKAITDPGFTPGFVWIQGTINEHSVTKCTSTGASTDSSCFSFYDFMTDGIQSLTASGFTVGTSSRVNTNAATYWYVAVKDTAGVFASGTYTGNGSDNRDITGVGFKADVLYVFGDSSGSANFAAFRTKDCTAGDNSFPIRSGAQTTNMIQSLGADGFQVGTATNVNNNGTTYYWIAMKNQTASGPANVKTVNGLAKASIKTINGLAIASIKTLNGLN